MAASCQACPRSACRGAYAWQANAGSCGGVPMGATTRRRAWRIRAAIKKQRVQPDRHPSLFGPRDCRWGIVAIRRNEEKTMKCLTILCLSLGLAGCYSTGPYASANGSGPVVDFSACAELADLRVDPLCHPLRRIQPK